MRDDRHAFDYEPVRPTASSVAGIKARGGAGRDEPWPAAPLETASARLSSSSSGAQFGRAAAPADALPAVDAPAADAPAARTLRPLKRGHAFSFAGLFAFTVALYFRPYELFTALSSLTSLALYCAVFTLVVFVPTQLALEGNFTSRPREVNLLLLLSLAALFSMPLAISPAEAWAEFTGTFVKAALMFVVMVNVMRTERRLVWMLLLALAVSCVLSVDALADFRAGRLTVAGTRIAGLGGGMLANPNDMALHLVTILPIAAALALRTRNPLAKLAYVACAGLMIAGIAVSFSRGGFLGLVGTVAFLAWKFGKRHRLVVALAVVVGTAGFVALAPGNYGSRLATILDSGSDTTGSSQSRRGLLITSLKVTAANPVFGLGIGNFHHVGSHNQVSHNAYTQVSSEMGLVALVFYVLFIVAPLKWLRRIEREPQVDRRKSRYYHLSIGLQAALVGYMISSFFASVAYQFYVYYLVGYAVCLRQLHEAEVGVLDDNDAAGTKGASGTKGAGAPSENYG